MKLCIKARFLIAIHLKLLLDSFGGFLHALEDHPPGINFLESLLSTNEEHGQNPSQNFHGALQMTDRSASSWGDVHFIFSPTSEKRSSTRSQSQEQYVSAHEHTCPWNCQ